MTIEVAGSPNDENELAAYRFRVEFSGTGFRLHLVGYRECERETEYDEWSVTGEWYFPDLNHKATLPEPFLPEWVKTDARANLQQYISFHE